VFLFHLINDKANPCRGVCWCFQTGLILRFHWTGEPNVVSSRVNNLFLMKHFCVVHRHVSCWWSSPGFWWCLASVCFVNQCYVSLFHACNKFTCRWWFVNKTKKAFIMATIERTHHCSNLWVAQVYLTSLRIWNPVIRELLRAHCKLVCDIYIIRVVHGFYQFQTFLVGNSFTDWLPLKAACPPKMATNRK